MTPAEEKAIVIAVLNGNPGKFALLIERYQKPIFNLMYRTCSSLDNAADLTQEAFIKAYERLETFDTDRKFFSWLYTIALNHARDYNRKQRSQPLLIDCDDKSDDFLPPSEDHRETVGRQLDALVLEQCMAELTLDHREALILRYREEMSMQDIADILDISLSAAKMRVHRALNVLKDILTSKDHG